MRSRIEIRLYEGKPEAAAELERAERRLLRASMLLRVGAIDTEYQHLLGRIGLAQAALGDEGAVRQVRLAIRRLRRRGRIISAVRFRLLLEAGLARLEGPRFTLIAALQAALAECERTRVALYENAVWWRLGEELGEAEGVAQMSRARDWMEAQAVARPDRLVAMLVPGWPHPG